jgi:hypothetical protein
MKLEVDAMGANSRRSSVMAYSDLLVLHHHVYVHIREKMYIRAEEGHQCSSNPLHGSPHKAEHVVGNKPGSQRCSAEAI